MKKWLPYVGAVVVALVVAFLLFRAPTTTTSDTPAATAPTAPTRTVQNVDAGEPIEAPSEGEPPPEEYAPGQVLPKDPNRPVTAAEKAQQVRLARPFNKHYQQVAAFWSQASRYAVQEGKSDLARECSAMEEALKAQSRLNDDEASHAAVLEREIAFAETVKAAGLANPEIPGMMAYVIASAKAVQAGQDPTTVPKPTLEQLQNGTYP